MNILTSLDNRTGVQSPSKPPKQATRPSGSEAEQAVTTLIRWAGDDPDREGLIETPARVVRAYEEWFAGYGEDPDELLRRTLEGVGGDDEKDGRQTKTFGITAHLPTCPPQPLLGVFATSR